MARSGSSSSALRRQVPFIPIIPCPDCGRRVERSISGTKEHDGWVFYKCRRHGKGCDFWHWELGYVEYLLEHNILPEDDAVDALGWAEDRRKELNLRLHELAATSPGTEEQVLKDWVTMLLLLKEALLLLKIVVGLLGLMCVVLISKK